VAPPVPTLLRTTPIHYIVESVGIVTVTSLMLCVCFIANVDYGHLIEIFDFPPQLQTCDLLAAFSEFKYVSQFAPTAGVLIIFNIEFKVITVHLNYCFHCFIPLLILQLLLLLGGSFVHL